MHQEIQGIVLRIVKYSDSSSIATVWTRQLGRMSVRVPLGSGREARQRRAIMMPMSVFEAVAIVKAGFEVANLRDVRPISAASQGNPAAGVVAMFLADFLYSVLKDSGADPHLADFLFTSAGALGALHGTALANFHLWFMVRLSAFLGFAPDYGSYQRGSCLDMRDGVFIPSPPMHTHYLMPDVARVAHALGRLPLPRLAMLRLSRQQRNQAIDHILDYYTLHHTPVSSLPSLPIVREIFA